MSEIKKRSTLTGLTRKAPIRSHTKSSATGTVTATSRIKSSMSRSVLSPARSKVVPSPNKPRISGPLPGKTLSSTLPRTPTTQQSRLSLASKTPTSRAARTQYFPLPAKGEASSKTFIEAEPAKPGNNISIKSTIVQHIHIEQETSVAAPTGKVLGLKKRNQGLQAKLRLAESVGQGVLLRWQTEIQGIRALLEELYPLIDETQQIRGQVVREQLDKFMLGHDRIAGTPFSELLKAGTDLAVSVPSSSSSEKGTARGLELIEEEESEEVLPHQKKVAGTSAREAECCQRFMEYLGGEANRKGEEALVVAVPGFVRSLAKGKERANANAETE